MENEKKGRGKETYAFVDAANLFYGGEKSMHFRVDYEKLIKYLREKFGVTKVFYYSGVDTDQYKEEGKELDLVKLVKYYEEETAKKDKTEDEMALLETHLKRARFYWDLTTMGYELRIKPTKVFVSSEGTTTTKANCDVDLTFDMMRFMSQYNEAVVMSGDGDFAPILEYLKDKKKKIRVLARFERTAREIKELAGEDFVDFKSLRKEIEAERVKIGNGLPRLPADRQVVTSSRNDEIKNEPERPKKTGWLKKIPTFRKGF
jgi:uncharacterized LabA/DUF88 family protein